MRGRQTRAPRRYKRRVRTCGPRLRTPILRLALARCRAAAPAYVSGSAEEPRRRGVGRRRAASCCASPILPTIVPAKCCICRARSSTRRAVRAACRAPPDAAFATSSRRGRFSAPCASARDFPFRFRCLAMVISAAAQRRQAVERTQPMRMQICRQRTRSARSQMIRAASLAPTRRKPADALLHALDVPGRGDHAHPCLVVAVGVPGVADVFGPGVAVALRARSRAGSAGAAGSAPPPRSGLRARLG